jgi:nitrite reductase (NADH) small subunit/3-phenylpropionate/trans-cinnamate dioxygenase ferredoxin subunit
VSERRVKVATTKDIPPGQGRVVQAGGRLIAVFNVDGMFYAIDNECPHSGGPLGEGFLKGRMVSCPWHLWRYDVTSGECHTTRFGHVRSYPTQMANDEVWVIVSADGA